MTYTYKNREIKFSGAETLKDVRQGYDESNAYWDPADLQCTHDGYLVVAVPPCNNICVYESDFKLARVIGKHGNDNGEFDCPASISIGHTNEHDADFGIPINDILIVADKFNQRLQFISTMGLWLRTWKFRDLCPQGLCVNSRNNVYVSFWDDWRIYMYSWKGEQLKTINTDDWSWSKQYAYRMCYNFKHGQLFVAWYNRSHVTVIDTDGEPIGYLGSGHGSHEDELKRVCHVSIDHQGFVFICDCQNTRICIYSWDGREGKIEKIIGSVYNIRILEEDSILQTREWVSHPPRYLTPGGPSAVCVDSKNRVIYAEDDPEPVVAMTLAHDVRLCFLSICFTRDPHHPPVPPFEEPTPYCRLS